MKVKNIEYRAMADGKHKVVKATIVDDNGAERKASRRDIQEIESIRRAIRIFMNDMGVSAADLIESPKLRRALEGSCIAFNAKERLLNDLVGSHLHSLTNQ